MKIDVQIDWRNVSAEFVKLNINDVKAYKNNAKTHPQSQLDMIKASIKKTGFRNPIEIDENNEILSGHGRIEALRQLKATEIPCIRYGDLTKAEKIAYRNNTNRTADFGTYDLSKLSIDFNAMQLDDFEKDMFGFAIPDIVIDTPNLPPVDMSIPQDNSSGAVNTSNNIENIEETEEIEDFNKENGEKRCTKCNSILN